MVRLLKNTVEKLVQELEESHKTKLITFLSIKNQVESKLNTIVELFRIEHGEGC